MIAVLRNSPNVEPYIFFANELGQLLEGQAECGCWKAMPYLFAKENFMTRYLAHRKWEFSRIGHGMMLSIFLISKNLKAR